MWVRSLFFAFGYLYHLLLLGIFFFCMFLGSIIMHWTFVVTIGWRFGLFRFVRLHGVCMKHILYRKIGYLYGVDCFPFVNLDILLSAVTLLQFNLRDLLFASTIFAEGSQDKRRGFEKLQANPQTKLNLKKKKKITNIYEVNKSFDIEIDQHLFHAVDILN